jgi:hypothetical protein
VVATTPKKRAAAAQNKGKKSKTKDLILQVDDTPSAVPELEFKTKEPSLYQESAQKLGELTCLMGVSR